MKKVVLVKLGGSVITQKEGVRVVREHTIKRLLGELRQFLNESDTSILLGHGQGSFAHVPAAKYQTKKGFINADSQLGMVLTSQAVHTIHQKMIDYAVEAQLPVFSYKMSSAVCAENDKSISWNFETVTTLLNRGLIPLTTGDVLADTKKGCTIWSTDTIFSNMIAQSHEK